MIVEIFQQVTKDSDDEFIAIEENVVEEDTSELIEVTEDKAIFCDEGRTYSIYTEKSSFSVLKDLEPVRFAVLTHIKQNFDLHCVDKKSEFISSQYNAQEMNYADHWATAYPVIQKHHCITSIDVAEVPKEIRKEIFWNKSMDIDLFTDISFLIEKCNFDKNTLIKAHQKKVLSVIIDGFYFEVEEDILKTLDEGLITRRINDLRNQNPEERERYLYVDKDLVIDTYAFDQFTQNDIYCQHLDKKGVKIPYHEEFEYGDYKIISPSKYMDLADESRAMHNCVGQPQQPHVKDIINGVLQVYFLRKGDKHIATIGVEKNILATVLGKFNTYCEKPDKNGIIWLFQEDAYVIDIWAKDRGIHIFY